MLDLTAIDPATLHLADAVCAHLLTRSSTLQSSDLMLIGAHCRDLLHRAAGHSSILRRTEDLDIALAIADWNAYAVVVSGLDVAGDTGVRFSVESVPTDLVPFGPVEDPTGVIVPARRTDELSVWAYTEVFAASEPLMLPTAGEIRIPTVPGYTALKLAAWRDRSERDTYKDAADIAAALYWYASSPDVENRLYDEDHGQNLLLKYDLDVPLAAAHLLGEDVAATVGPERCAELAARWPGPRDGALPRSMAFDAGGSVWPTDPSRRQNLVAALVAGWYPGR